MSLEIRKTLVLSTSHVTKATAKMLDSTPCSEWPAVGGPYGTYGWFFYAHDENCEPLMPDDLFAVMTFANANGCDNVLFDCDALEVDGLPTYDW